MVSHHKLSNCLVFCVKYSCPSQKLPSHKLPGTLVNKVTMAPSLHDPEILDFLWCLLCTYCNSLPFRKQSHVGCRIMVRISLSPQVHWTDFEVYIQFNVFQLALGGAKSSTRVQYACIAKKGDPAPVGWAYVPSSRGSLFSVSLFQCTP